MNFLGVYINILRLWGGILTAKEYLEQLKYINKLIESNKRKVEEFRLMSQSLPVFDYSKDKIQSSITNDSRSAEYINKMIDCIRYIEKDTEKLIAKTLEIKQVIDQVQDVKCRLVLQLRYIENKEYHEIHNEMDMRKSVIYDLHKKGLKIVSGQIRSFSD